MNNNRIWILGAIVVTAVILAGGWFLGVSPMLTQMAANETARQEVIAQNASQKAALASLKERYAQLPSLREQLDSERLILPAATGYPDFLDGIDALQSASGAHVVDLSVGDALQYVPGVAPAPAEPAAEAPVDAEAPTAEGDGSEVAAEPVASETEVTPAVGAAPATSIIGADMVTPDMLSLIPVTVSVQGDLDQSIAYLDGMQANKRLFLPTKITVGYDKEKQIYRGEIEGYIYVLKAGAEAGSGATVTVEAGGEVTTTAN